MWCSSVEKSIVSFSVFDSLFSKCKITRDSCIQLELFDYTLNENKWELFCVFFATSGIQNSFFLN